MKTTKGYPVDEIPEQMSVPLDPSGFKRHPTKSYLTTISPAHTRERLTKVFGTFGYGWGLDWDPDRTNMYETETSTGKTRFNFSLMQAEFWYTLVNDSDDRVIYRFPVTGFSDNDNPGDAMAGARTSAISAGAKELLFQLHIYKNEKAPPKKQAQSDREFDNLPSQGKKTAVSDNNAWYRALPAGAKDAYKATDHGEMIAALSYVERYDNPHAAQNALALFVKPELIQYRDKNRDDAKARVLHWKRVKAYAVNRNAGMNKDKAKSGALSQVKNA